MLKTKITRLQEGTGYARIAFQFYIEDGDKAKWKALGEFLVAVLPREEAQQLVRELEVEMQKRGLAK